MTKTELQNEVKSLYRDIDQCISALIRARVNKDKKAEELCRQRMETLLVSTMQELTVVNDFLTK